MPLTRLGRLLVVDITKQLLGDSGSCRLRHRSRALSTDRDYFLVVLLSLLRVVVNRKKQQCLIQFKPLCKKKNFVFSQRAGIVVCGRGIISNLTIQIATGSQEQLCSSMS